MPSVPAGNSTCLFRTGVGTARSVALPTPCLLRRLAAPGRLARVHGILEIGKTLPRRLGRIDAGARRMDRRLGEDHLRDVARAVRIDRACLHPHDELRADGVREQRIVARGARGPLDAQPLRFLEVDEQEADMGPTWALTAMLPIARNMPLPS